MSSPHNLFQVWYVVYLYVLPLMLYASWAALSLMDMAESAGGPPRTGWGAAVLLLPLVGGAAYLLFVARGLGRSARRATVLGGLLVWLVPLAVGLWLAGGPLGPKALS
jgi:hypothetical protein